MQDGGSYLRLRLTTRPGVSIDSQTQTKILAQEYPEYEKNFQRAGGAGCEGCLGTHRTEVKS